MRRRYEPWDKKFVKILNSIEWEVGARYLLTLFIGICIGIFLMLIQFQHQIISVMEGSR